MSLDVKEAERLIQLLNSSANSNTVLSAEDTTTLIAFFNSKATNEAELSRLKQTLLSALKYSLSIADTSLALQRAGGSSDGTTLAKKLILELLNHDSLEDGSSFIHSALDIIISNLELTEMKLSPNTNSLAVELLLVPFMSRLDSDFILEFLERICGTAAVQDEASQSEQESKLLNPHVAPALLQEIHDLQNMTNLLTSRHLASLSTRVLASLNLLVQEKEFESIPPLLYQLCALTKLASSKKKGPFAKETEVSYQILYGVAEFLSTLIEGHEVICTCLSHIGRTLRSNPSLPKVLLNILKGKKPELIQGEKQSLRFTRMTPMLLAMGMTMASSIPRMKIVALEAIRDLVLEEEMVRSKRYSSKFVNTAMAFLMNKENIQLRMNEDGNFDDNDELVKEAQESVFSDLKYYADSKECTDKDLIANSVVLSNLKVVVSLVQGRSAASAHSSNEVEFSSLLPTLISLGFMLIDAVKKDIIPKESKNLSAYLLPPIPSCQTELEGNSMSTIQQKANQNTAKVGRALLVYLFLHGSGKKEDEDEDIVTSAYNTENVEPHCRLILQSSFEKFCGMNPNAFEHALLLRDLISNEDGSETKFEKIETISQGAHMMEESFIPMIIDLLANIPSGGMPARVSSVVFPVLNVLLKINLLKAKRSRRKRNALSDHIDHCFLLAKKALFCTDVARRKIAVNLLVMILSIAIEIPKDSGAIIEEVRGYLRRCMTQYQCEVRREAYISLIALCPDSESNVDMSQSQSQSQELLLEDDNESISDIEVNVIQILAQQLDRYMVVEEDASALEARRKRALARGTHLSQQVEGTNLEEGIDSSSCPLRIDLCIAAGGARTQTGRQLGETVSKKKAKKPDLLEEAVERVTEPISFLLASVISILEAKSSTSQEFPLINALRSKLGKLSRRMANSDLEDCLKRLKDNFSKNSSPYERHVKTLSFCLLIVSTCEALMSFCDLSDDDEIEVVARLFRLRQQALTHSASTILSAKVLSTKKKPVKKKKKKRKDSDADEEEDEKPNIVSEESESSVLMSTNSVNEKVLEKIKMSVEAIIPQLSPAVHFSFLQEMFGKCGILGQTKASDDVLHDTQDDDEENDSSFKSKLTRNEAFRRFLLEKSRQTICGETLIFKPGFRFDIIHDLTSKTDFQFVCPIFQLAPALFTEFLSHVQDRQFSSLTSQTDSPLSALALDGLKASAYRLLLVQNQMSPIIKVRTMISTILLKASSQFPSFGKAWETCSSLPSSIKECFPKEEIDIVQKLFPFVMPVATTEKDGGPRCGLLAELVQNGLETEACSLCEILKCIISALSPISRKILGFMMIQSFEKSSESDAVGVIGIQGDDDEECGECAFHVFESMIYFDGMMNGIARIPKLSQFSSNSLRMNAGLMELKPAIINQILERNLDSTEFQPLDGDSKMSALQVMSLSLQATIDVSTNFQEKVKDFNVSTYKLACIDAVATTLASSDLVSKHLTSSSSIIIASLENGIADVEFLNKLMSTLIGEQSVFVQRFITKMLFALGKILSVTSLYAASMDDSGNFMSNLMKISKRIYANYTKLLGFLADNPHCINHVENKVFLKLLREKLQNRISALLLTLSEKTKMGKKSLGEGKIAAYGRIAEQLVFEIERCDNALLKLSSKLKSSGFEEESTLLLDTMGSGSSDVVRGFKLQENVLKQLREEEEHSKTSKKRKKSKAKKGKSSKRQKVPNESDEGNDSDEGEQFMSDDNSSTADQSIQDNEDEDSENEDSESDNSGSDDDDESQINFDLSMDDGDETEDEMD
ncbi:hypothetical protein CTEN210_16401 [Chaetoceros tenuissimus]|uniref:Uncharacterized protein n=1 Tax=Chaetoceros tenuissimus TaxID=426638 RepID=A0AAD3DAQ9_9STRA|nr:hypothetical protein CTEN210_16401 [Chaetoceros tenuissimus]